VGIPACLYRRFEDFAPYFDYSFLYIDFHIKSIVISTIL